MNKRNKIEKQKKNAAGPGPGVPWVPGASRDFLLFCVFSWIFAGFEYLLSFGEVLMYLVMYLFIIYVFPIYVL